MYEIDFLPVGEGQRSGDAIAIRFEAPGAPARVVIIDGGYRDDGPQLVDHVLKYYDTTTVDLVIATHSDADHINGLSVALEELNARELMIHRPGEHASELSRMSAYARLRKSLGQDLTDKLERSLEAVASLIQQAERAGIPVTEPFTGVQRFGGALTVVGPTEDYYTSLLPDFRSATSAATAESLVRKALRASGQVLTRVMESVHIETLTDDGSTSAENSSSAIIHLEVDNRRLLFTGDAGIEALTRVANTLDGGGYGWSPTSRPLDFIQIPHHGSKHNVGPTILNRLLGHPGDRSDGSFIAIASAAETSLKHPSQRVINAFVRRGGYVGATNGVKVCHSYLATPRNDYNPVAPLPLVAEFDED